MEYLTVMLGRVSPLGVEVDVSNLMEYFFCRQIYIKIILLWDVVWSVLLCCSGRVSPLGVEIDAVVVRVPSHVFPVRKGRHRGGVTFMRAASSLMPSTCFIVCLLFAWTNFHVSFAIAAPTLVNVKARCVALAQVRPGCSNR